jgi:hypothetical protein
MHPTLHALPLLSRVVLVASFLSGPQAHAEAPTLTPEQERLVEAGLDERASQRDERALEHFQKAHALGHDARILAQIAFAEQALGRWVEGYGHLQDALAAHGHPWIEEHRALLVRELALLASHVARLEIVANVAGAELLVQGERAGWLPLGVPVVVLPGRVMVEARAQGYVSAVQSVDVDAAALSRVELKLLPRSGESEVGHAGERGQVALRERDPRWFYGVGVGGAAAAASLIPWLVASNELDALERCSSPANGCSDASFERRAHAVQRLDTTTNALLFTGLAVAVVSGALYWLLPHERRTSARSTVASAPGVRF